MMLAQLFCSLFLTTSVIIPCYHGHLCYLEPLLDHLSHQTVLPDEVIISLSEVDRVDANALHILQNKKTPFPTHWITHSEKLSAGYNRNKACALASGDILICQDADDIPHPQRIEIINYFFKKYDLDILIHRWTPVEEEAIFYTPYQKELIPFFKITRSYQLKYSGRIHNGNNALHKRVFKKYQWNNMAQGEDYYFNFSAIQTFKNSIIIDAALLLYRFELSSFGQAAKEIESQTFNFFTTN